MHTLHATLARPAVCPGGKAGGGETFAWSLRGVRQNRSEQPQSQHTAARVHSVNRVLVISSFRQLAPAQPWHPSSRDRLSDARTSPRYPPRKLLRARSSSESTSPRLGVGRAAGMYAPEWGGLLSLPNSANLDSPTASRPSSRSTTSATPRRRSSRLSMRRWTKTQKRTRRTLAR